MRATPGGGASFYLSSFAMYWTVLVPTPNRSRPCGDHDVEVETAKAVLVLDVVDTSHDALASRG